MDSKTEGDRKRDSARRTEGEGIPAPDASVPAAGNSTGERHREDGSREQAEPQRRKPDKVEQR